MGKIVNLLSIIQNTYLLHHKFFSIIERFSEKQGFSSPLQTRLLSNPEKGNYRQQNHLRPVDVGESAIIWIINECLQFSQRMEMILSIGKSNCKATGKEVYLHKPKCALQILCLVLSVHEWVLHCPFNLCNELFQVFK